ncbi:MAG TPA: fluoride efflux transporter CrcB [Planctomycetota bacterium]|nr:fluoride efflux transporter CrcB [Planctomycetota bacterium]
MNVLAIAIGGALGALARYGLSVLIHRWLGTQFPYGTLAVNVLGCLVIGWVMFLAEERQIMSEPIRMFLTIGILGAFTTFSTFGFETYLLARDGHGVLALASIAGNLALGLGAVWVGRVLAQAAG